MFKPKEKPRRWISAVSIKVVLKAVVPPMTVAVSFVEEITTKEIVRRTKASSHGRVTEKVQPIHFPWQRAKLWVAKESPKEKLKVAKAAERIKASRKVVKASKEIKKGRKEAMAIGSLERPTAPSVKMDRLMQHGIRIRPTGTKTTAGQPWMMRTNGMPENTALMTSS